MVAGGAQAARSLTERIRGVESLAAISDAEVQETGSAKRVSEVVSQRLVVVWPPFSALDADGQQRVVTHELTHAALAGVTSGRTPSWLIEGIALYVSEDRRIDDAAPLPPGEASGRARRALSLRALSEPDAIARLSGDGQAVAYAYASAASFYIAERFGRRRFIKLYNAFNDEDLPGHAGLETTRRAIRARWGSRSSASTPTSTRPRSAEIRRRPRNRPLASGAMPELPEVETIRRHLAPHVDGRTLHGSRSTTPAGRCRSRPGARRRRRGPPHREARPPRQVPRVGARGRGLPDAAPAHDRHAAARPARAPAAHARDVRPRRAQLEFVDPRRFGTGELALGPEALDDFFATRLGVEPFEPEFTGEHLYELTRHSRAPDQGDAARPEADRRRRQHLRRRGAVPRPHPPAAARDRINRKQASALRDAVVETLELGIESKGATIDDFRDPEGVSGSFQDRFLIHLREGEPCVRCGRPVRKLRAAGRGTYVCESCQPRPRRG